MNTQPQAVLQRFLAGRADDGEVATAEALLSGVETVSSVELSADNDDLLQAFRQKPREALEQAEVQALAERIGQWLAPDDGGSDDWRRCLEPPREPDLLGQIGRFSIRQLLARGGTGLVFEALDGDSGQSVCLKLLQPHRAQQLAARQRFLGEAKTAKRLQHPRIVPIHEVAQHGELPYLVMPLLAGQSLGSWLQGHGQLDSLTAVRVARQVAEGLEHAHGLGILHRDIKPDNLWIGPDGQVQILDFGLARTCDDQQPITLAGTVLGTPSYMSPEQVTGKPLDGRSDLFSLGVVLWEMLTGHSPFRRDNLFSTLMSVATDELDLASLAARETLPPSLTALLGRLLAKDPTERPASAGELLRELDAVQATLTAPATAPLAPLTPVPNPNRWHGGRSGFLVAALAGAFFCWLGFWLWESNDKGTLVVETHDGQVEVVIKDQKVTVTDPVTNKVYGVSIGATPLPSGVYLLEASIDGGDLEFSSQTIVIRRGQQSLVTVRLRSAEEASASPPEVAGGPTSVAEDRAGPKAMAERTDGAGSNSPADRVTGSSPLQPSADPSFAPEVEATMAARLDSLPAQPSLADYDSLTAISRTAMVTNPLKLPNYDSWSLEVPPADKMTWTPNCDQSLWVGVGQDIRDMVWVADPSGQVRVVIPTVGMPILALPSPVQPRLLATLSWRGSALLGAQSSEDDERQYDLQVWRLEEDGVTLLNTWATSWYQVVWDGSYRLLFPRGDAIWAYRLDTGRIEQITGRVAGNLTENSLSPNKRWLALPSTSDLGNQIEIHNLQSGQRVGEFNILGYQPYWSEDRIIVPGGARQPIEVWQVEPLKLMQRIEPPGNLESEPAQRSERLQAIDTSGQRVAYLSEQGELTITRLSDRNSAVLRAASLSGKPERLVWQADGTLLIQVASRWFQWRANLNDLQGRLTEHAGPPPLMDAPFELGRLSQPEAAHDRAPTLAPWPVEHPLGQMAKIRRADPFRLFGWSWDADWTRLIQTISPNGAFHLRGDHLWSTESDEMVFKFGSVRPEGRRDGTPRRSVAPVAAWSQDHRWLLVPSQRSGHPTLVFDLATRTPLEWSTGFPADVANRPVGLFQAAGSLFWLTLEGESQVWEVDPERAEVRALPMTDGIQDMKPFHLAPPYAFFRSGLAGWYEDASLRRQFLRAKWEEGRWTDLQELTMGINDELIVSPTGLGYLRIVDPPGTKIQSGRTGLVKVLSPNGRYQLTFARWPAGQPGGQPQDQVATWEWISWSERSPQWHESGRSLVLHSSSYLGVVVFELASGKHHEHLGWASRRQTTQAIATDYGWLMGRPDQWMALGHDGQKLGVLPVNLPADFDGHINETPRGTWILSDGRSCPLADGPRYFVGRRGPEFVTIPWSQCPSELSLPTYPTDTPIEVLIRESQRP